VEGDRPASRDHEYRAPETIGVIHGNFDKPGVGDYVGSVVRIVGWAFGDPSPVSRIEVALDDRFIALLQAKLPRSDVKVAYPQAPDRTGFATTLNVENLAPGPHLLRVTVYDSTEAAVVFERTIVRTQHPAQRSTEPGAPKIIALYLPQYHPNPENDAWWGPGFTDWTKVAPARPLFKHHYQPHVPADLGFYDLRLAETREAQARLAAEHGIYGFAYYHYWFHGRKVLDRPLREVLSSQNPDFPFCVCFANENWTRRWDGKEDDVLLAQRHSPEDDLAFIRDLLPVFSDDRYIRIDGRPLLLVYRPSLFPNPRKTAELWRAECIAAGVGNPYLAYMQSFSIDDPASYGFDAAVEFPPLSFPVTNAISSVEELAPNFSGGIFDYEELRDSAARRPEPSYTLFRGVMPSWDNTARRGPSSSSFINASPEGYRSWLAEACNWTMRCHPPSERLVFVNAWNEWGEGCHLEPDQRYGHLYLQATRDVAERFASISIVPKPRPQASVVVPCYNHEKYVVGALESVLDQTIDSLEVIVVDDGSRDGSIAAMNRLAQSRCDARLRIYGQTNRGAHETLNVALERARGEFVAILNSDDYYAPERLEAMIGELEAEQADFAFSRVAYVDDAGNDVTLSAGRPSHYLRKQTGHTLFPDLAYALLDFNLTISTGNFVFRRSLYERIGGFKPLLWCHDWDFALRALRRGKAIYVDRGLYYYRFHDDNSYSSYTHLGAFEGAFVMEEFFSDHTYARKLFDRDPEYYRRFVAERGLGQFGAIDAVDIGNAAPA
jgi:glycosyltransferase involved in cell wall biosynthesis